MVPVWPMSARKLRHVVGDASVEGFVIAMQRPGGKVTFREGLWTEEFAEGGSNLREAQNHVNFLLAEISYLIINLISIFFNPFHFVVQAYDGDLHCLYIFV